MFPCFNEATAMVRGTLETDIMNAAKAGFRYMEIRKEKLMRFLNEGHKLPELKMHQRPRRLQLPEGAEPGGHPGSLQLLMLCRPVRGLPGPGGHRVLQCPDGR